jgi:uncharacterized protein
MSSELETNPFALPQADLTLPATVASSDKLTVESPSARPPRPWGPWATVGWTLVCITAVSIAQVIGAGIYAMVVFAARPGTQVADLVGNGVSAATVACTPAAIGLVVFLVWIRRYPIREYLALTWPDAGKIVVALVGLLAVLAASDLTTYALGRPIVPPFMVDVYRTAWLPGLLIAVVVLAPLGEETLYRGFLYKGIAASNAGPVVAVLVSTIIFTLLHASQYDWYALLLVAVVGLYLGVTRYKTGSVYLTMCLHAVANTIATAEVIVQQNWFR